MKKEQGVIGYSEKDEYILIANQEKQTKTERYGWARLKGKTALEWISKKELMLDVDKYQRTRRSTNKILRLAREFDMRACNALVVALRYGSGVKQYFVVDGGHRLQAAWKREDIDMLPCLVYASESVPEEATLFRQVNKFRSNLPADMDYRAALAAGDSVAWGVERMIRADGYTVNPRGKKWSVKCIRAMLKWYKNAPVQTKAIWPLVVKIHAGEPIDGRIFEALAYRAQALENRPG